jgi:quinol monooxygenase YgiN
VTRAAKASGGPYEARNEFVIPGGDGGVVARFEEEMRAREKMAKECGATEAKLVKLKANEYAFEQKWASKEAYEAYMNTPGRRRSHLTVGVYQRLPKDKWSVPENFTPVTR